MHFIGNSPKENAEYTGLFLSPVIPFVSNQCNYGHMIHRSTAESYTFTSCNESIATGGNDDLSNSITHVIRNHPELAAWKDGVKHSSIRITQYKASLEKSLNLKKQWWSIGHLNYNPLGFSIVESCKKDKRLQHRYECKTYV